MDRKLVLTLVVGLTLAGCGGGGGTDTYGSPQRASLRIASGAGGTDTAYAMLASPLVVEVQRGSGSRAGIAMRFDVVPSEPSGQLLVRQTSVASSGTQAFSSSLTVATDAAGRAQAHVRLGSIIGETRVAVSCLELGLADTARFRVEPGLTSRIVLSVRDTVILAGTSFTVRAFAADNWGNWTQEPVAFGAGPNVLSVTDSGRVRTAKVAGRGVVRVSTVFGVRDSVRITSFAGGRIAFLDYANDAWGTLTVADIDGTNRRIIRTQFALSAASPFLAPDNDAVVFNRGGTAMTIDANLIERAVADPVVVPQSTSPRFGRDGQYVYFAGRSSIFLPAAIWRVRRDGSAMEQLSDPSASSGSHGMPAPSPDGARVAYLDATGMHVLALATKQRTTIGSKSALFPDFSPDGTRVAYVLNGAIHVVNADGSGDRVVAIGVDYYERPSWLPNSNWLLLRSSGGIEVIEVTTGERAILNALSGVRQIVSAP